MKLSFDPSDPFPLLPENSHSYREAQEHSRIVDEWLGLRADLIEKALTENKPVEPDHQQLWIDLPVHALQTPYTELRLLLNRVSLSSGETLVDLGSGYGRMGFVMARHYPDCQFVGYEYVRERAEESQRALLEKGCTRARIECADLADVEIKPCAAAVYFLYDYGSRAAIEKTLFDLQNIARHQTICVVGRGRGSRDEIERRQPWLSQVWEPAHYRHYSIYRSGERQLS